MTADANIQVWVAAQSGLGPDVVVPYVKTVQARRLRYRIEVSNSGEAGSSRIRQSGELTTAAGEATELSELRLSRQPQDRCSISVDLSEEGAVIGTYSFDCDGAASDPSSAPPAKPK